MTSAATAPPRGVTRRALNRLLDDLAHDRVTTSALARRVYHVTIIAAAGAGVTVFTRPVEKTVHARRTPAVRFFAANPRDARIGAPALRHLAGITATRHALGAHAADWENHADRVAAPLVPDALWTPPEGHPLAGGTVAIEYDASSYGPQRRYEKMSEFQRAFAAQVWSAATDARAGTLRRTATTHGIDVTVLVAPWWN